MGFFEDVLPNTSGWVPLLTFGAVNRLNKCRWFSWPDQGADMAEYVELHSDEDVYFSPMLYTRPPSITSARHATKANVIALACAYTDGDDCPKEALRVEPTTWVQTSRERWQAYWRFDETLDPFVIEGMNHALVEAHAEDGMDNGWALAKKLRVPFSHNTKPKYGMAYEVNYETIRGPISRQEFLDAYGTYEPKIVAADKPMPAPPTANDSIDALARVGSVDANSLFLYELAPGQDWSGHLYRLECLLWEAGASDEDVFTIAWGAVSNKFVRDGRPIEDFWEQVLKDRARWDLMHEDIEADDSELPRLPQTTLTRDVNADGLFWTRTSLIHDDDEVPSGTFIDAFVTWARSCSAQSPEAFNVAGGLILLSSSLARYAKLPLSFGDMSLNLYMLILGRTTQSRKSTSLNLAKKLLRGVSPDEPDRYLLPEDVTPEALSEHLSGRARGSSVLTVDEVQGMFEAVNKKGGYLSGLIHLLTNAYGGTIPGVMRKTSGSKYQPAVDHYLSFYGTGIMDQAAAALTPARIESGFVPRCLAVVDERRGYVVGARDVSFRNVAEGIPEDTVRKFLQQWLAKSIGLWEEQYQADMTYATCYEDIRRPLSIDDDAFERWQVFAEEVTTIAADHPINARYLVPIAERMHFSVLKVAALLSMVTVSNASTEKAGDLGRIRLPHVVKAINLADTWVRCSEIFVQEVCSNGFNKDVSLIEKYVASRPEQSTKYTDLLNKFQSTFDNPRRIDEILDYCRKKGTLIDVVRSKRAGDRYVSYIPRVR